MDSTQQIEDSFIGEQDDSDDQPDLEEGQGQGEPLAVLKVFKNNHIPETGGHYTDTSQGPAGAHVVVSCCVSSRTLLFIVHCL